MTTVPNNFEREVLDRLRRMETRLTSWLVSQGFETHTTAATLRDGELRLPSPSCTLKECLDALQSGETAKVVVGSDHLATITKETDRAEKV